MSTPDQIDVTAPRSPGRLAGRVAIVTGGASGIGLATVRRFVREGAQVVVGDLDRDGLASVEAELGDAVVGVACDVTVEDDVEAMGAAAIEHFGALHIVFANAGIGSPSPLVAADPTESMRVPSRSTCSGPMLDHQAHRTPHVLGWLHRHHGQPQRGAAGRRHRARTAAPRRPPPCWLRWRPSSWARPASASTPSAPASSARRSPRRCGSCPRSSTSSTRTPRWPPTPARTTWPTWSPSWPPTRASSISGTFQLIDRGAHTKRYPDVLGHIDRAMAATTEEI